MTKMKLQRSEAFAEHVLYRHIVVDRLPVKQMNRADDRRMNLRGAVRGENQNHRYLDFAWRRAVRAVEADFRRRRAHTKHP